MARYYDASVGRFITRDTFQGFENEPLSLNQYAYTKNNPVMYVDPTGHVYISKKAWYWWGVVMYVVLDDYETKYLIGANGAVAATGNYVASLIKHKASQVVSRTISYISALSAIALTVKNRGRGVTLATQYTFGTMYLKVIGVYSN